MYTETTSLCLQTTVPDSALKKKSQSITYHFVHKGVVRDECHTDYVNTHDNEADLLTKLWPSSEKHNCFVQNLMHHIFQSEVWAVAEWITLSEPL